jgi:heparan-alpha-glucosaminide N-acetyltransferase
VYPSHELWDDKVNLLSTTERTDVHKRLIDKMGIGSVPAARTAPRRNTAIDSYRGFVMLLMMAEVLRFSEISRAFPTSWFWSIFSFNQTHEDWAGCSLHDMIQPSFSFLVGLALPYSIASRLAKGAGFGKLLLHAMWRALILIALGIFLRSMYQSQTYFTFEDTLTQIGLGYVFLFSLGFVEKERWLWIALGAILFGYWLAWGLYPAAGSGFNWQAVGVPPDWSHHYPGFMAHWNKNANLGNAFDQWFLNLFPRTSPFVYNAGGYLTLSFIPTLGTMLLGLIAGRWKHADAPRIPFRRLLVAGVTGVALGLLLHGAGLCPIVKRIWTPSWTLFSGGICFLMLAGFEWVIEAKGYRKWAFPLVVIGMNSIAAYLIAHFLPNFLTSSFRTHFGANAFKIAGPALEPLLEGAALLLAYWMVLFWMYRRKLFLRV